MLYYIYKVKENQSESEVNIMRIYVVTEMKGSMEFSGIHGATTDREKAIRMAQVVMRDALRGITSIDIDKYIAKQTDYFDRSTRYGMNCIDTCTTVQITMFDD